MVTFRTTDPSTQTILTTTITTAFPVLPATPAFIPAVMPRVTVKGQPGERGVVPASLVAAAWADSYRDIPPRHDRPLEPRWSSSHSATTAGKGAFTIPWKVGIYFGLIFHMYRSCWSYLTCSLVSDLFYLLICPMLSACIKISSYFVHQF